MTTRSLGLFAACLVALGSSGLGLRAQAGPAVGSPRYVSVAQVPRAPVVPTVVLAGGEPARTLPVDARAFGRFDARFEVVYDPEEVLAPVAVRDYARLPAWAVAARLLLAEVGVGRLTRSEHALAEAVGILETIRNRLEPAVWDAEGRGVRPWPGCAVDDPAADPVTTGAWHRCATPSQYLGLRHTRALAPRRATRDDAALAAAVDVAVAAWVLHTEDGVAGLTHGAVSFVHRCGGAAYGARTVFCDRRRSTPDVRGAESTTGPIVFKGPGPFLRNAGRYELVETQVVDFVPGDAPRPRALEAYVLAPLAGQPLPDEDTDDRDGAASLP